MTVKGGSHCVSPKGMASSTSVRPIPDAFYRKEERERERDQSNYPINK